MAEDRFSGSVIYSDSSIRHWPLSNRVLAAHSASSPAQQQDNSRDHSSGSGPQQQPLVTEPDQVIRGGPSIRSYTIQVLNLQL